MLLLHKKENPRSLVCALPLVFSIMIFFFTLSFAYSDDRNQDSAKNKTGTERSHNEVAKRRNRDYILFKFAFIPPPWDPKTGEILNQENSTLENYKNNTENLKSTNISNNLDELSDSETEHNSSKPCPTCKKSQFSEEDIIATRIADLKKVLYEKLHVTEESVSSKQHKIDVSKLPPEIRDQTLRDNARLRDIEEFYAKDQQLMVQGHDLNNRCLASRYVTGCYIFHLTDKIRGGVKSAKIWFYKMFDANDVWQHNQTIRVMELGKKKRNRTSKSRGRRAVFIKGTRRWQRLAGKPKRGGLVATKLVGRSERPMREGWVSVNLTGRNMWTSTVMLAIQCKTCYTRHHRYLFGRKEGYKPLLVINYDESAQMISRKKRTPDDNCDPATSCCKKELEINFAQIDFSVVIPETLSVGYCYGSCRHSIRYPHNHTRFTQNARNNDNLLDRRTKNQLARCCVPTTLLPATLNIQVNSNSDDWPDVRQRRFERMIVHRCGCM